MRGRLAIACMLQVLACSGTSPPQRLAETPIGLSSSKPAPLPSVASPVPASGEGGDPESTARVAAMLKRVSKRRGLEAKKTVPGVTLERDALLARLRAHVDQEIPKQAILDEGAMDSLLGLVPQKFDYENAMYSLLEAQLAGYYEPEGGVMLLAADLDGLMAEGTLAHELTHALQDQHYDLKALMKYQTGHSDATLALQCLAEGDATSAMFDVMAPGVILALPDEMFVRQVKDAMDEGPGADAPRAMKEGLAAPYVDGVVFVHGLRRAGGWPAVDAAWQNLPQTTEQILHADKFASREPALAVDAPTTKTLGADFTTADADTYGELPLRIMYGEWMTDSDAADAASHWGGDRAVLARRAAEVAFGWRVRYDAATPTPGYADRAFVAVSAAMVRKLGPAKIRDAAQVCFERPGHAALSLSRAGNDLLFTAGPALSADMTPRGDCALAQRWSREVLGVPKTK